MDNKQKLLKLMVENPELPIYCEILPGCFAGEGFYSFCEPAIVEQLVTDGFIKDENGKTVFLKQDTNEVRRLLRLKVEDVV